MYAYLFCDKLVKKNFVSEHVYSTSQKLIVITLREVQSTVMHNAITQIRKSPKYG